MRTHALRVFVALGLALVAATVQANPASAASGGYRAVTPARIADTRGTTGPLVRAISPRPPRSVTATGLGGVPASGVQAVVLNVTVTSATANSHLTLWPTDQVRPNASNINFVTGQTIANLAVVKLSPSGQLSIFNNAGNVHVILDVVG